MDQLHASLTHGRRLFDVELDNQHEEPLLLAQLAAQQLLELSGVLKASPAALTRSSSAALLKAASLWRCEVVQVCRALQSSATFTKDLPVVRLDLCNDLKQVFAYGA